MRPSPLSASSPFSDPKPRMGTLKYVLPSTETRTASPVPFAEPLPSEEKPPRITPPPRWRSRTGNPSSSRPTCSCWPPSRLALVAFAFAVKTTSWARRDGRGLERVERGRRRTTRGWRHPPPRAAPPSEKTKMVSEPWLLTRTSKSPLALATTSIAAGQRGRRSVWPVVPTPRSSRCPVGTKISTTPSARATTTCPLAQGLRGHHLLAGVRPRWRRRLGFVEVEPHQVSPGRHRVAHTAVAREGGWLDHRTAQVEQDFADPGHRRSRRRRPAAGSRCRCRR